MIDHTHDPDARCWVEGADSHDAFPVQNLPLGVFSVAGGAPRIGTAIADHVLDLAALAGGLELPASLTEALAAPSLNALLAEPPSSRRALRHALFAVLTDEEQRTLAEPHLLPAGSVIMHVPARIGDYTDFYVGIHHATNIGRQFRPDNPLLPNYKHIPIGYHGRASSIRVSGEDVRRPRGQIKAPDADGPDFAPCRRLDYEMELGVWIAGENALGEQVPISEAADRMAGLCLLNDWSARDIQGWEYQPLGPFLAKSFHTTISPWIITREALAPFRIAQPARPDGDPRPLPYLMDGEDQTQGAYAIELDTFLATRRMRDQGIEPHRISAGQARSMYWTVAQMIAHHTSNGCNLMPGDLLGTGTISGPDRESLGSLMEISEGGTKAIALPGGETRCFLEDGDEVTLTATARLPGFRPIGFGACTGTVIAAP